jgi:hypothetical protein
MRFAINVVVYLICFFVLVVFVQPGAAHAPADVDVTCPLCHTTFKSMSDMPGRRLGMRLDLKPMGPGAAPASLHKCPNCHFIVYSKDLKEGDKRKLLKLINSREYRHISVDNPTYYLLAKIYETMGKDDLEIAHAYLRASWQVEHDSGKCAKYLEASYAKFGAFLSSNKDKSTPHIMAELVSGEIERRLGRFDQALSRFSRLQKQPEFSGAKHLTAIINYQLELIAAKDIEPHEIRR